ncbi:CASP C terminal-domain-containing protein [Lipomyces oligophaga]|uniref:CASP C terminal-domain-containing protein n=1 Tax=Lipomyces oligophaga TaxID=45792 RepID=UPI0034CD400D
MADVNSDVPASADANPPAPVTISAEPEAIVENADNLNLAVGPPTREATPILDSRAPTPSVPLVVARPTEDSNIQSTKSELTIQQRTTPFEQALQAWGEINLTDLQKKLDTQGLEIVENQKTSVVGRKELATKTKEFRKLSDQDKLTEIKVLLKAYQTEIDNLTKRGKTAENAFLNTYRVLAEAPDPYPLLEATLDSLLAADEVAALSKENAKLKSQLAQYADYDDLKLKITQTEQKVIDVSAAKVAAKENELQALMDEKERNWKLREEELGRQVTEARDLVYELRATHAVTEARLSRHEQKLDEGVEGRFAEAEMIAADLERVNLRALQTERRNLELRQELEKLKSEIVGEGSAFVPATELVESQNQVAELKSENLALGRKIDAIRDEARAAAEMDKKQLWSLQREGGRKAEEIEGLKKKLAHMNDYEDIKRELDVLKFVEFSVEAEDESEDWRSAVRSEGQTETLEQLLLARNKKLNSEVTTLRVANDTVQKHLEEAESKLTATTASLEQSQQLIRKLEDDLAALHETASLGSLAPSGARSVVSYAPSRRSGKGPGGDTASILGASLRAGLSSVIPGGIDHDLEGNVSPSHSGTVTPGGNGGLLVPGGRSLEQHMADATILPIITQQRDRFRARNSELEQELRTEYARITELQNQLEALQKDNIGLFEKIRYLSTYRGASANLADIGRAGEGSRRYEQEYEEQISPFARFRGREQERAMSRMGPLERVIYGLTRVVLANKATRNLFFMYITGLHVFLLGTLWVLALNEMSLHEDTGGATVVGSLVAGSAAAAVAGNGLAGSVSGDTMVMEQQPDVESGPDVSVMQSPGIVADVASGTNDVEKAASTAANVVKSIAQSIPDSGSPAPPFGGQPAEQGADQPVGQFAEQQLPPATEESNQQPAEQPVAQSFA